MYKIIYVQDKSYVNMLSYIMCMTVDYCHCVNKVNRSILD